MKELSIEEKAKAYDEALRRANEYHFDGVKQCIADTLEYIFPELKESDDERIRKDMIAYFKHDGTYYRPDSIVAKIWIAWLEKQGTREFTTEALIDKACNYFRTKKKCIFACIGEDVYHSLLSEEEIDNFRTYMKGE